MAYSSSKQKREKFMWCLSQSRFSIFIRSFVTLYETTWWFYLLGCLICVFLQASHIRVHWQVRHWNLAGAWGVVNAGTQTWQSARFCINCTDSCPLVSFYPFKSVLFFILSFSSSTPNTVSYIFLSSLPTTCTILHLGHLSGSSSSPSSLKKVSPFLILVTLMIEIQQFAQKECWHGNEMRKTLRVRQ